jgi:tRNA(Ile)-lysidine synthase TilS/MesJ
MVCISGGKDSFLLAKCIQELIKHGKFPFTAHYVVMDPGYNKVNRQLIEKNAKLLNVPIEIFETNIFDVTAKVEGNPCYLCARMRRGYLYSKAKELGCNKIALGHHFDDVIETILMSLIFNGEFKTMMPKLKSTNFKAMELIRPLYFVREKDIISFCKYNDLHFIDCACSVTKKGIGMRKKMKDLINTLNEYYRGADKNIMNATYNVNLNIIINYIKKEEDLENEE